MNATLPTIPAEVPPTGLVRAALAVEPALGRYLPADELQAHFLSFCRALRRSTEREASARKDTNT